MRVGTDNQYIIEIIDKQRPQLTVEVLEAYDQG
jgi:hypothetical protein